MSIVMRRAACRQENDVLAEARSSKLHSYLITVRLLKRRAKLKRAERAKLARAERAELARAERAELNAFQVATTTA